MVVGMMDETGGSQADETVHFGLDGAEFELNLSKAQAEELRHVLDPYIQAGRKTRTMRNGKQHGVKVSNSGRVSLKLSC
jgi:Lsr2